MKDNETRSRSQKRREHKKKEEEIKNAHAESFHPGAATSAQSNTGNEDMHYDGKGPADSHFYVVI